MLWQMMKRKTMMIRILVMLASLLNAFSLRGCVCEDFLALKMRYENFCIILIKTYMKMMEMLRKLMHKYGHNSMMKIFNQKT